MNIDPIEKRIMEIIDEKRLEIIDVGNYIWKNAELGYKEFKTSSLFAEKMQSLGMNPMENLAITGVKSYLKPKKEDEVNVCIMGELDALPISTHIDANEKTGASHCCGHNAQMAGIIGAAMALSDPQVKNNLDGNIIFFAVPAEEFIDIEFKQELMKQGKITYGGGKCELIKIGALDDVDITIGHHATTKPEVLLANHSTNGFVNKVVKFKGIASHASVEPHMGVDALAAYTVATNALDAQRPTFKDKDTVRIHGFVSHGGEAMNIIADYVSAEYSVRAKNIPAFVDANKKFDRAMKAGAAALGAGVEISTMPGYLPTVPLENVGTITGTIQDISELYQYKYDISEEKKHRTGSTDYGDLSSVMPLLQFETGGYDGMLHNKSMQIINEDLAYIITAKIFAITAYRLLKNKGEKAREILDNFKPLMTKEEYLQYMNSMNYTDVTELNPLPTLGD